MRMVLTLNEAVAAVGGPATRGRVFPYLTWLGFPTGDLVGPGDEAELSGRPFAAPGMVVVERFTDGVFAIDSSGEAVYLGLKLPARASVELEQRPGGIAGGVLDGDYDSGMGV